MIRLTQEELELMECILEHATDIIRDYISKLNSIGELDKHSVTVVNETIMKIVKIGKKIGTHNNLRRSK